MGWWPKVAAGSCSTRVRRAGTSGRDGRGLTFTGGTEHEADTYFPMLGVNLAVLDPGEPNSMYHWETETEAFLVLSGEALLIVEGQERPLRQWDFVHCPPEDGARDRGSGRRPLRRPGDELAREPAVRAYGAYTVDEAARRHGACSEEETQDGDVAYANVPDSEPARYRDGWLPGG